MDLSQIDVQTRLAATRDGAVLQLQNRKLSPTTTEILKLLAVKADEAIKRKADGIDVDGFLEDVQSIETINSHVANLTVDAQKLSHLEILAKLGDYAMMYCQRLKEGAAPGSMFKKMRWMDVEKALESERTRLDQWASTGEADTKPPTPMMTEIEMAMLNIEDHNPDQAYWVIKFYAHRNHSMHSNIIDHRLRGEYTEVLKAVETDLEQLPQLVSDCEGSDIAHYQTMLMDFRRTWFDHVGSPSCEPIWIANWRAKQHLAQLAKDSKNATLSHQSPETELGKVQKSLHTATDMLQELMGMMGRGATFAETAAKIGTAGLELQAASQILAPNTAQRDILSRHDIYKPETKRRRNLEASNEVFPPFMDGDQ